MSSELDSLEKVVERQMHLLRALPTPGPSPDWLARLCVTVVQQSRRQLRRQRLLLLSRAWIGVAAGLLLVAGWTTVFPRSAGLRVSDPEAVLREWAEAWDESGSRLTALVSGDQPPGDWDQELDAELEDLLRSLDQSFDRFEAL